MRILNPNDKVLKFIEKTIIESHLFDINKKEKYNHNILLEEHGTEWDSYMSLIIECERKFKVKLSDLDVYKIETPLELHSLIIKEINENNKSKRR